MMIPTVDIAPLFAAPNNLNRSGPIRTNVDRQICQAAQEVGFLSIVGAPFQKALGKAARTSLLRLFSIPAQEQRRLWKRNFAPENANLYRGWFPLESGERHSREGFEIGPDLIRKLPNDGSEDLLYEPSCFPARELLPGWREDTAAYYRAMESIGDALLASIARGLSVPENLFAEGFRDGISTLRLLHYPGRDADEPIPSKLERYVVGEPARRMEIVCGGHVDSGLVTILAQCDAPGLQVKPAGGGWLDVPPTKEGFVVNFGGLLERWTGGRIQATQHRVLSTGEERFSIPFFVEPRPDTRIAPLPLPNVDPFEPFLYGDHLWATTTKFAENYGLGHLRTARAPYRDPFEMS